MLTLIKCCMSGELKAEGSIDDNLRNKIKSVSLFKNKGTYKP